MTTDYISIKDITISDYQRETLPWTVQEIAESIKDHGFNPAYPVVIDENNVLIDGGHRIEAAKICELSEVPFIRKSANGTSNIRYALQCNADRAKGREDDVFDLAELCWKLAGDGWDGKQIAKELGWSEKAQSVVSAHKAIKTGLHSTAWNLARFANIPDLQTDNTDDVANRDFAIAKWKESHFRPLLSFLSLNGHRDNAVMRAQLATVRQALDRFAKSDKKITASWIGEVAERYAWHVELSKYIRDNLVKEVPLKDRKDLLHNIKKGVFGNAKDEKNLTKLQQAVALINQRVLGVKLYQDDAFQRIPLLSDKSVALIVTDPPYNVTDNEWDKIGTDEQYLEWLEQWLDLIRPKLSDDYHLFLFCSPEYQARVELLLVNKGWPLKSRIVWWHRNLSMGRDVSDKFICNDERVFHCGTHSLNWSPEWNEERFAVQEWAAPQSNFVDGKPHPTSKPIGLVEHFVRIGSKPGDIVLDTFAGGGTTGEACRNVRQRRCILIEKSSEYCEIIEKRLQIKRIKEVKDEAGN